MNKGIKTGLTYHRQIRFEKVILSILIATLWLILLDKFKNLGGALVLIAGVVVILLGFWGIIFTPRVEYVKRVTEEVFDDLIEKMYAAGLKIEGKYGKRYIFITNYILFPKDYFMVKDCGDYCEVLGVKTHLNFLSKAGINLAEKFNIKNPGYNNDTSTV